MLSEEELRVEKLIKTLTQSLLFLMLPPEMMKELWAQGEF